MSDMPASTSATTAAKRKSAEPHGNEDMKRSRVHPNQDLLDEWDAHIMDGPHNADLVGEAIAAMRDRAQNPPKDMKQGFEEDNKAVKRFQEFNDALLTRIEKTSLIMDKFEDRKKIRRQTAISKSNADGLPSTSRMTNVDDDKKAVVEELETLRCRANLLEAKLIQAENSIQSKDNEIKRWRKECGDVNDQLIQLQTEKRRRQRAMEIVETTIQQLQELK